MLPENPQSIDHLIVIVHPPALPERLLIVPEDFRKLYPFHLDLGQLLPSQHLVLGIGDGGHQGLHCALAANSPVCARYSSPAAPPLSRILQQGEAVRPSLRS